MESWVFDPNNDDNRCDLPEFRRWAIKIALLRLYYEQPLLIEPGDPAKVYAVDDIQTCACSSVTRNGRSTGMRSAESARSSRPRQAEESMDSRGCRGHSVTAWSWRSASSSESAPSREVDQLNELSLAQELGVEPDNI